MSQHDSGLSMPIRAAALGLTLLLVLAGGCSTKGPRQTPIMRQVGGVEVSSNELRVFIRDTSDRFAGVIEVSADEIIAGTDDPQVRYNALIWKSRAIPVGFDAVFQSDPLVAVLDSWAFAEQLRQYFTTGAGKDLFGDQQPIAIRATDLLEFVGHRAPDSWTDLHAANAQLAPGRSDRNRKHGRVQSRRQPDHEPGRSDCLSHRDRRADSQASAVAGRDLDR
jgi:hypothetical protein